MKKIILSAIALLIAAPAFAHPVDYDNRKGVEKAFNVKLGKCAKQELRTVKFTYGSVDNKQRVCVAWEVIRSNNKRFAVGSVIYVAK